jgi:hypothetical protein
MITTTRAGYSRKDVLVNGVPKGYVVSILGSFSAFDANGDRIYDGANLMFPRLKDAVSAVAGS